MKVTLPISNSSALDSAGGYWEVMPDGPSEQLLRQIASSIMDTDDLHDLHVTLAYDNRNPVVAAQPNPDAEFTATIKGVALFGGEEAVLVLLLDSPDLQAEHDRIHACGCANFDFKPYQPHVSLKYGAQQRDLDFLQDWLLKPGTPPIDLLFTGEHQEPIDNDAR